MRVNLAAQVMSCSLAVYIEEGYRSGWLPTGALSTSAFIGLMDDLFDSMNGGTEKNPSKPLLSGVSLKGPHFRFWKEAASLVSKWKIVKDFKEDEIIFSSMPPTQKGWLNNLQAFPMLCREILNKLFAAGKCISTRSFNQDPLEVLFGTIRSNCGDNRNCLALNAARERNRRVARQIAHRANESLAQRIKWQGEALRYNPTTSYAGESKLNIYIIKIAWRVSEPFR